MKTVSVILASYNGGKYIRNQLDSILAQTYPVYEILIGDDGSTDDTIPILNEYAGKYSHIIIIQPDRDNHGVNYNFKRLMDLASGDYLALSDQDDIWFPEKIEVMIKGIGSHLLAYSDAIPFSGTPPEMNGTQSIGYCNSRQEDGIADIMFNNVISGHRMLTKREFIHRIREWNSEVYYDWWLAVSASYLDSIAYIPQPLVLWRRHAGSMTDLHRKRQKKVFKIIQFLKRRHSYFQSLVRLFESLGMENEKQLKVYRLARKFASKSLCANLYGCLYYSLKIKKIFLYSNIVKPLKMWSK